MVVNLVIRLKSPAVKMLEDFCDRFPLFSMVVMQAVMAVAMLAAVSAIALAGGSVIWLFYKASGLM